MTDAAITGQVFLSYPEIKRYRLKNIFSNDEHIVTEQMIKDAFSESEYNRIMSNRHQAWFLEDIFED